MSYEYRLPYQLCTYTSVYKQQFKNKHVLHKSVFMVSRLDGDVINPRRACAASVTVRPSVRPSVCPHTNLTM